MAPDDRRELFDIYFEIYFNATPRRHVVLGKVRAGRVNGSTRAIRTPSQRPTLTPNTPSHSIIHIQQGLGRGGETGLYILEAKPARITPDGVPHGIALKFDPCPPSRHVINKPKPHPCSRQWAAAAQAAAQAGAVSAAAAAAAARAVILALGSAG